MMMNSAAKRVEEKTTERRQETRWAGIGINAVAAASICRDKEKVAHREVKPMRRAFPFSDHDFATD
jgi:hypothetical protein